MKTLNHNTFLTQANKAFNNNMYVKALWYYERSTSSNELLKNSIELNMRLTNKKKLDMSQKYEVEVIVPVHNALEDLIKCIKSIIDNSKEFTYRILLINDSSNKETTGYLRDLFDKYTQIYLVENEYNLGYSHTVNKGLKLSSSKYIVLLNSDAIVGKNWLKNLKTCIDSSKSIGIVGPLSNAATWQSIPKQRGDNDRFFINDIPDGFSVGSFVEWVDVNSSKIYPKVQLLNGFCMMLKREVIDKVGYIDVENFPIGYGEETDYCIRAREAGFELAVADDTFVYHSKSKSFGHEKRSILSQQGETSLKNKYGKEEYNGIKDSMKRNAMLNTVRENILAKLKKGEYVT